MVENLPASERDVRNSGSIPGSEDFREEEMAAHSNPVWRTPQTEGVLHAPRAHYAYSGVLSTSVASNSATPGSAAPQAPLSMEFSKQGFWNELPFPPPGDLPNLGISPFSPILVGGFFTSVTTWKV